MSDSGIDLTGNDVTNKLYKYGMSEDLWLVQSYCMVPTVEVANLRTGEVMHFGVGAHTDAEFKLAHELPNEVSALLHNNLFRKQNEK